MSVKPTNIPKCHPRQSADSAENISRHRKLGELTENIRTFALPNEPRPYTFKMKFRYDSWNRIQRMTYPDGEVVRYGYNRGGMLRKVQGAVTRRHHDQTAPVQIQSLHQPDGVQWNPGDIIPPDPPPTPPEPIYDTFPRYYIDSIAYNIFELRQAVFYGNGTRAYYTYDSLQRLQTLRSHTAQDPLMQDIHYTYDSVGNITDIVNNATMLANGLGGRYGGHYTYDNLYRLVTADGYHGTRSFNTTVTYTANGRILNKSTNGLFGGSYSYDLGCNKLRRVVSRTPVGEIVQSFRWNICGNMTDMIVEEPTASLQQRVLTWTEDNRLQTVADNNWFSYYQYDAGGERTYKLTWVGSTSNRNGQQTVYYTPDGATLYASPYLVITPQGYTKHYYAEQERITSQIGNGGFSGIGTPLVSDSLVQVKLQAVTGNVEYHANLTVPDSGVFAYLDTLTNRQTSIAENYFYHPDHLGSSSWITDSAGNAIQHLYYLPWGEDFVNQRTTNYAARFTFSAKEKDSETGLSYFGARYYSSDLSIWLSVDPQASKYPSLSPYSYCANNPIKLVDSDGEAWETPEDEKKANEMKNKAIEQISHYQKQIDKCNATINRTKDAKKREEAFVNAEYLQELVSEVQNGIDGLDKMGDDSYYYHFEEVERGKNCYSERDIRGPNDVHVTIYSDDLIETRWHECKHIQDWLNGVFPKKEHDFDQTGRLGNNHNNDVETSAYRSEFAFSTRRFDGNCLIRQTNINDIRGDQRINRP